MENKDFRILMVDDSEPIRAMLRDFFSSQSEYQLFEACDGQDALDFLDKNEVHLIITDIVMPNMDGLTLLKQMKYKKPDVPIIVISGYNTLSNIETAFKYYAVKFFSKPFEWEDLFKTVKKAKNIYESTQISKNLSTVLQLSLKIKISPTNSKIIRLVINKIINVITELYMISYEQGTKIYVLLTEFFLIGRNFLKGISKESYLNFNYDQEQNEMRFSIEDPVNEFDIKAEFEKLDKSVKESLNKYADEINFNEKGTKILVSKKI